MTHNEPKNNAAGNKAQNASRSKMPLASKEDTEFSEEQITEAAAELNPKLYGKNKPQ